MEKFKNSVRSLIAAALDHEKGKERKNIKSVSQQIKDLKANKNNMDQAEYVQRLESLTNQMQLSLEKCPDIMENDNEEEKYEDDDVA